MDGPDVDARTAFECGHALACDTPIIGVRTECRPGSEYPTRGVGSMLADACEAHVHLTREEGQDEPSTANRIAWAIAGLDRSDSGGSGARVSKIRPRADEVPQQSPSREDRVSAILQEAERRPVAEVARHHGISEQTLYAWRRRSGRDSSSDGRPQPPHGGELERENESLKKLVAERDLELDALKQLWRKNEISRLRSGH